MRSRVDGKLWHDAGRTLPAMLRPSRSVGASVTRFKDLERIEAAIENGIQGELEWGLRYCENRLRIATMKAHVKTWSAHKRRIEEALERAREPRDNT